MPRVLPILLLFLLPALPLLARTSLDQARHARALLGPATWSRIIEIENNDRRSPYPRIVHALVFELAGTLWFYTDTDGTQSFSLYRNRLDWEKEHFGPLLLDIAPGFQRWTVVETPADGWRDDGAPLRNGCFIESVALLRERLARGLPVRKPRLLSYYAKTATGLAGHTVLACETGNAVEIVNPLHPRKPAQFPLSLAADPLTLAQAVENSRIISARVLPLDPEVMWPDLTNGSGGNRVAAIPVEPRRS